MRKKNIGIVITSLVVASLLTPTVAWADNEPAPVSSSTISATVPNGLPVAPSDEETKTLLGEYGISKEKLDNTAEAMKLANQNYATTTRELAENKQKLAEVEKQLKEANTSLAGLKREVSQKTVEVQENQINLGRQASAMYRGTALEGKDVSLSMLFTNPDRVNDKLDGQYVAEHVMAGTQRTIFNQKQIQSQQESAVTRQNAVSADITRLKSEASKLVTNSEQKQRQAQKQKTDMVEAKKSAEKALADAKASYEKSVADAKKAQVDYDALVKKMLAESAQRGEGSDTVITNLPKDVFPLPHPTNTGRVTSGYGFRATPAGTIDYGGKGGYVHAGIDYGAQCGSPVRAVADGKVWLAGPYSTAGNAVGLDHGMINGFMFSTKYHHLSKVKVAVGTVVKKGDVIALSGNTGNSSGCHLHFETMVNGKAVNPQPYL